MPKRGQHAFFAVAKGRGGPRIYDKWDDCEASVKGFSGAMHKGFATKAEAEEYLHNNFAEPAPMTKPSILGKKSASNFVDLIDSDEDVQVVTAPKLTSSSSSSSSTTSAPPAANTSQDSSTSSLFSDYKISSSSSLAKNPLFIAPPDTASSVITISGVRVPFPAGKKPFPQQIQMMTKLIMGCQRLENSLLESPTGTGKTLALLCASISWQRSDYEKRWAVRLSLTLPPSIHDFFFLFH